MSNTTNGQLKIIWSNSNLILIEITKTSIMAAFVFNLFCIMHVAKIMYHRGIYKMLFNGFL